MPKKNINNNSKQSIGGFSFFLSLISLIFLSIFSPIYLLELIDSHGVTNLFRFLAGIVLGLWIANKFIKNHLSVFFHELKHSILSNFAGNKYKRMKIDKDSGYFEYSYTEETEKYNSLISLAPYFLPLFTLPVLFFAIILNIESQLMRVIVGAAYGADCMMNFRDISSYQTDLTNITGGYLIALLFIIAVNLVIFTYLLSWVLQDFYGVKSVFISLYYFIEGFFYQRI